MRCFLLFRCCISVGRGTPGSAKPFFFYTLHAGLPHCAMPEFIRSTAEPPGDSADNRSPAAGGTVGEGDGAGSSFEAGDADAIASVDRTIECIADDSRPDRMCSVRYCVCRCASLRRGAGANAGGADYAMPHLYCVARGGDAHVSAKRCLQTSQKQRERERERQRQDEETRVLDGRAECGADATGESCGRDFGDGSRNRVEGDGDNGVGDDGEEEDDDDQCIAILAESNGYSL